MWLTRFVATFVHTKNVSILLTKKCYFLFFERNVPFRVDAYGRLMDDKDQFEKHQNACALSPPNANKKAYKYTFPQNKTTFIIITFVTNQTQCPLAQTETLTSTPRQATAVGPPPHRR